MLMLAVSLGALASSCGSQSKSSLLMNLAPSTQYRLSIRTDGTFSVEDNQDAKPRAFSRELVYLCRVMSVYDNGDVGVALTVEKAKLLVISDMYAGSTFSARVSPAGEIVELAGTDAVRAHVQSSIQDRKGSSNVFERPEALIVQISDEAILAELNTVFSIWPSTPVAQGDSWTRPPIFDPTSKTYEHTKFRLMSVHASNARIEFSSEHRLAEGTESESVGSSSGEIHVSPTQGVLRSYLGKKDVLIKNSAGTGRIESTTYATFTPL
jgi:hypothetical protein